MKRTVKGIISLFLVFGLCLSMVLPTQAANPGEAEMKAAALKELGLFAGVSATDFDLDRAPTRAEALVMLVRVLGKEAEAASGSWQHPFTDVPPYADKCIGYAYQHGLTGGISATKFGTGDANSDMYLTFVLRALGYHDFLWNAPDERAQAVGILPEGVDTKSFLRADIALVSWAALAADLQDGSQTLCEKLIAAGVFTLADYRAAQRTAKGLPPLQQHECAVFTFAELQAAAANSEITAISIAADIDVTDEFICEREDDLSINVAAGSTLTISAQFVPVGCSITNDGAIVVSGNFSRGISDLINNGSLTVKDGGQVDSGMSNTENCGTFAVETGGILLIDRGSAFANAGNLINDGYICISDGGSLNNQQGEITNNGTIDLYTYFDGNIADITGTGTLNDKRD